MLRDDGAPTYAAAAVRTGLGTGDADWPSSRLTAARGGGADVGVLGGSSPPTPPLPATAPVPRPRLPGVARGLTRSGVVWPTGWSYGDDPSPDIELERCQKKKKSKCNI
jgi:hypothetical protein